MPESACSRWLGAGPLVSDGAWGTELQNRGLGIDECPDLWNLRQPGRVADVARQYHEAGSQVVLTNTFRANRLALEPLGAAGQVRDINAAGVELSRRNAPGALVFASVGPSGKMLVTGDVSEEDLLEAFQEQTAALAEAGADAILVETMSDVTEASIALRAARKTGLPVILSFAFDSGKNKDRTMMGATPEQCAAAAMDGGAVAVGANCGVDIAAMVAVCERLAAASGLPVWVKPNAGLPSTNGGAVTYSSTPEAFASFVPALLQAGAKFVGGCCGTDPRFIRAIAKAVRQ